MEKKHRSAWAAVLAAAVGIGGAVAVHGGTTGARELVKQTLEAAPKVPFFARLTLSSSRGWERELELRHKQRGDAYANYMEVTAPHDVKDTRFLFFERTEGKDEQYVYVPALRRAIRIAEATRKQPFLGSDFYVSDLVAPELDAFRYAFVGEDEVEGRKCKLVQSVPKQPAGEVYGKTVLAIDPEDHLTLRTQFYDHAGELLKVWTVKKLEKIDGVWTAVEQEMKNLKEGTVSNLVIDEVHYNVDLSDSLFSRGNLTR